MSSAVNSISSNQGAYQTQVANNGNDRQLTGLKNSLGASEKMAKAMGFDTTAIQSAKQAASGNQAQAVSSEKVSLSSEGVAKQQADSASQTTSTNPSATAGSRAEKRQFKSVDEAIAYGTSRATEQATARSSAKTNNTGEANSANSQNTLAATNRPEKKQFNSVEEAISYGAQRAVEQYAKQQKAFIG